MSWTTEVIALAIFVVAFLAMKRRGQISRTDALTHLRNGALVVDVRSAGEFNSGHLPDALNFPLDEIETALPLRVKDKNRVLLLHCQSGMRSGAAMTKLRRAGYPNTFNLGSYAQAAQVIRAK